MERESADIEAVMTEASEKVQKDFPEDSFQRVLWEEQQKYNKLKNKRQMPRILLNTFESARRTVPHTGEQMTHSQSGNLGWAGDSR